MHHELRRLIDADLYRYRADTSSRARRDAWLHEPGFRFTYLLRQLSFLASRKRGSSLVAYASYRALYQRYRFLYGFDISPTTLIGPGLYIGHFGGVVVSPHAVLGANINLAQGITIGATSRGSRKGAPTLHDRVWVGANAVIVGSVTIGDDALIAPGAYVNFDVPPRSVVLGNPGTVVSQKGSAGYVNNILGSA